LSLFCIGTTLYLIRGLLLLSGLYTHCPLLTELIGNGRYFLGPALYFYIKITVDPDLHFKKFDIIHLVPVTLNLIINSPFYFSSTAYQVQFLTDWLDTSFVRPEFFWDLFSRLMFVGFFCFYIIISVRFHREFRKNILESSTFGEIYLSWIRIFTYALSLSLLVWIACAFFIAVGYHLRYFLYSMNLIISFLVFFCILRILMRPEILYMARPVKSGKKYQASYLTKENADLYFEKIKCMMEQEQDYLDPDLDLAQLSEKLSISKNYLSQIINDKTGKTFNDFINCYRIEKIKKLLQDPNRKEETILMLAFTVGFNSKTPFYNAFKKLTGESPIAFRKKHIT
jgi:AraC-like DNA-binding protein